MRHEKHRVLNIATYNPEDDLWRGLTSLTTEEMRQWQMEWWPIPIAQPPNE